MKTDHELKRIKLQTSESLWSLFVVGEDPNQIQRHKPILDIQRKLCLHPVCNQCIACFESRILPKKNFFLKVVQCWQRARRNQHPKKLIQASTKVGTYMVVSGLCAPKGWLNIFESLGCAQTAGYLSRFGIGNCMGMHKHCSFRVPSPPPESPSPE